jgi:O-acetyl-ADP-ribose deacetylase (regulator of RNase III)
MTIIKGDVLNCKEDVIAHQVNCKGVMGGGVALTLKEKYPENFAKYKNYCQTVHRLGDCLVVNENGKAIANLFGQDKYGTGQRQTDYDALESALTLLRIFAITNGLKSIAIPYKLGCGLAGGDWRVVSEIIDLIFDKSTGIDVIAYRLYGGAK